MKTALASLLGALLACALPTASLARDVTADIVQLEPWAMENPNPAGADRYVGIYPEIAKELARRSGVGIVPHLTPYARIEKELQDGTTDLTFLAWSPTREGYVNRGATIVWQDFGVRAVKGATVKSYDDLKKITVSVTRGLKVQPRFDDDATLKKELDLDYSTGVKKADAGRVQGVAGSIPAINRIIRHAKLSERFEDTLVLQQVTMMIQYSKKSSQPDVQAKLDAAMSSMVADGFVKKTVDRWMND